MHVSKPRELTPPGVSPEAYYNLWMIKMCQRRFISVTNVLFSRVMSIMGEAVHMWGQEAHEKSLHRPLNGVVNLKLRKIRL